MNMTQANEALANYQHYALTQYTLNLHDIAEHGAYGINEVRTCLLYTSPSPRD